MLVQIELIYKVDYLDNYSEVRHLELVSENTEQNAMNVDHSYSWPNEKYN